MKSLTNGGSGYINGINNRRARRRRERHGLKERRFQLSDTLLCGGSKSRREGAEKESLSGAGGRVTNLWTAAAACCEEFLV